MNHSSKEQVQAKTHETSSDMDVLPAMDQADPMFRRIAMQSSPFEILRTDMAGGKHLNMNQEKLYEQKSKQKTQQQPLLAHYNVEIIPTPTTLAPAPASPTQTEMERHIQQQEQRMQRMLVEAREEFMEDSIPEIEEDAVDPVDPVYQVPMGTPTNLLVEQVIRGCCQLKWTDIQLGSEWNIQLRTLTGIEEMEWDICFGQKSSHELVVVFHLIAGQNEQWYLDSIDRLVCLCPCLYDPNKMHHDDDDSCGNLYPQCTASNPEDLKQLFHEMNLESEMFVRHNAIQAANRLAILSQDRPTRVQWLTQQNELMNGLHMMLDHSVVELQCASLFVFLTFLDDQRTSPTPCFAMSEVQARTQAIREHQTGKQQTMLGTLATELHRHGC